MCIIYNRADKETWKIKYVKTKNRMFINPCVSHILFNLLKHTESILSKNGLSWKENGT